MASPLLETKIYVPRPRRGLVPRPRLSERLNRGAESKLTLVSAPAGFGKTTLLAEWLAAAPADERSAAWLSLDHSDNDPASFWTYLITALQTVEPGCGGAKPRRQSGGPLVAVRQATSVVSTRIGPMVGRTGRPLTWHRSVRRGRSRAQDATNDASTRRSGGSSVTTGRSAGLRHGVPSAGVGLAGIEESGGRPRGVAASR